MYRICLLLGPVAFAAVSGAVPPERIIIIGETISAKVNGTPVQIRVDPAADAMPLIDAGAAQRAGLKRTMFGFIVPVGPQKVIGATAVARLDLGDGPIKRRMGWTARRFAAPVEGVIGPGGLPNAIVRFQLRAARPGERTWTLPMVDQGGLMSGLGERFASILVGGRPLRVLFDPYHRRTLATAGAAVRIAAAQGGTLTGAAEMTDIAFGIARPVREMKLARLLGVGPFAIASIGVRTNDFGSVAAVPEAGADPDEIVVTAKARHDGARDRLKIGNDLLDRCSTLIFDNAGKLIQLTCG